MRFVERWKWHHAVIAHWIFCAKMKKLNWKNSFLLFSKIWKNKTLAAFFADKWKNWADKMFLCFYENLKKSPAGHFALKWKMCYRKFCFYFFENLKKLVAGHFGLTWRNWTKKLVFSFFSKIWKKNACWAFCAEMEKIELNIVFLFSSKSWKISLTESFALKWKNRAEKVGFFENRDEKEVF